jgi:NAD(P)H-quinone oxidoreductase subunit K
MDWYQASRPNTASTVTIQMAPSLVIKYSQMPEQFALPSYGSLYSFLQEGCSFSTDSYSTVRGVEKPQAPLDVYLPGCPPKPEAVINAITKLRKKVSR